MKSKKSLKQPIKTTPTKNLLFSKENYRWMLIGIATIAIGIILMPGGKSNDPNVFDTNAIYSFARITLSPILIVGGLAIEVYAIMKKGKEASKS